MQLLEKCVKYTIFIMLYIYIYIYTLFLNEHRSTIQDESGLIYRAEIYEILFAALFSALRRCGKVKRQ